LKKRCRRRRKGEEKKDLKKKTGKKFSWSHPGGDNDFASLVTFGAKISKRDLGGSGFL